MLEARIESPRGSLYYASEATPYDLELLRRYVHDLTPGTGQGDLQLDVAVDDGDPVEPVIARWLGKLAATGVHVARSRCALLR